jgi:hypothetical protein
MCNCRQAPLNSNSHSTGPHHTPLQGATIRTRPSGSPLPAFEHPASRPCGERLPSPGLSALAKPANAVAWGVTFADKDREFSERAPSTPAPSVRAHLSRVPNRNACWVRPTAPGHPQPICAANVVGARAAPAVARTMRASAMELGFETVPDPDRGSRSVSSAPAAAGGA